MYQHVTTKSMQKCTYVSRTGKTANPTMKSSIFEGKTTLSCPPPFDFCSVPITVLQMPKCRLGEIYFSSNRLCYSCHSALKQFSSPVEHRASNIFAQLLPPVILPPTQRVSIAQNPQPANGKLLSCCIYGAYFQNIRSHPATGKGISLARSLPARKEDSPDGLQL